jgi:predicted RNA-binding protein
MRHRATEHDTTDMTQLLEIINAKGDEGELRAIVEENGAFACNDELFWKELRTIAEDSAKMEEEDE